VLSSVLSAHVTEHADAQHRHWHRSIRDQVSIPMPKQLKNAVKRKSLIDNAQRGVVTGHLRTTHTFPVIPYFFLFLIVYTD
jgi:hypothetical protein